MAYPPFVKMPGTGKADPRVARPGKIPVPRDARTGPGAVLSGVSFVLAVIYAGLMLVSLVLGFVPGILPASNLVPSMVVLVILAILIHLFAMWGDSISRSGDDWGVRAIVVFWVASGCWFLGGMAVAAVAALF